MAATYSLSDPLSQYSLGSISGNGSDLTSALTGTGTGALDPGVSLTGSGTTGTSLGSALLGLTGANSGGLSTKDYITSGLTGLSTIGGLISSLGSLSLANKEYNLQKQAYNTNLANSVQAYNTQLEDIARSRGVMEGQSTDQVNSYIAAHKATTG